MRKILYIVLVCSALSAISCSKEALNTSPSGSLTPGQVFENSEAAQSAVDGIYRLMYTNGWCGFDSEHPGLAGFTMAHSLMGEDHLQYAQSSGWFYYDYAFLISQDWTATYGRQHGTWNMFYTFISLANYVIDHEAMFSADATGNDVLGQAYAIRAFSYYYQDPTTGVADIINLRAEELLLTLAECLVREDSDYTGAREWEGCLT